MTWPMINDDNDKVEVIPSADDMNEDVLKRLWSQGQYDNKLLISFLTECSWTEEEADWRNARDKCWCDVMMWTEKWCWCDSKL